MDLAFEDEPVIQEQDCPSCRAHYLVVKAFVVKDGIAHAIAFASLHRHRDVNETWIDAIFGTFTDDADDHVTLGCRVGPVEGEAEQGASLVDAAAAYEDSRLWGIKLTVEEARGSPRLAEYWALVDFLLLESPVIHAHVYGIES